MLRAIGEPQTVDTRNDPRMSRLFANKVIKIYPAFAEFYGMEDARGQYNLGLAYAKGEGVPVDVEQGYFWLLLASAGGDATSMSSRDFVETRLTPTQRLAAQAVARDWKPRSQ